MAQKVQIGGNGLVFIGEDKIFRLFVYERPVYNVVRYDSNFKPIDENGDVVVPRDENGVAVSVVDMSGKTVRFVVKRNVGDTYQALIDEAANVMGAFNANPTLNTQRLEVTVTDDDLAVTEFTQAGNYKHSWKEMTPEGETVLSYGPFVIEEATQV